jgi:hypothetical protein
MWKFIIKKSKILIICLELCLFNNISLAQSPPPSCIITGLVINPSTDQPYSGGNIYFNSNNLPLQVISGTTIQPLQFTVKTNTTGFITPPLTLPQGLQICIIMGGPAFPGTLVKIPNTTTADFSTILSTDSIAANPNPCTINPYYYLLPIPVF